MSRWTAVVVGLVLGLGVAPATPAGCWSCDAQTSCCTKTTTGNYGSKICFHNESCIGDFCACYFCNTSGDLCEGSAPSDCTDEDGIGTCEENRSFHVVPHGEAIELPLLGPPPAVEPSPIRRAGRCGAA